MEFQGLHLTLLTAEPSPHNLSHKEVKLTTAGSSTAGETLTYNNSLPQALFLKPGDESCSDSDRFT
jgi:hypothetical protein